MQFDHLSLRRIDLAQFVQRPRKIERQNAVVRDPGQFGVERDALPAPAALLRFRFAGVVDQNSPGQSGGKSEEFAP